MSYVKKVVKDREYVNSGKFLVDGKETIISRDQNNILEAGTPVNKELIDHIQDGIVENSDKIIISISEPVNSKPETIWIQPQPNTSKLNFMNLSLEDVGVGDDPEVESKVWFEPIK